MTTEVKRLQFIEGINVNTPTQTALSIMPSTNVSTTPYTALDSDTIFYVDTTIGNITINLPAVATPAMNGKIYYIKKISSDANTVIIDPSGAETIEGAGTYTLLKQNDVIATQCNAVNWKLISDLKTLYVDQYSNQTISGLKTFSDITTISNTTESTSKDDGAFVIEGGVGIEKKLFVGGNFRTNGNAIIDGDLTVQGATTTINTTVLDVEDANITINKGGNQLSADDIAGLTVEMSDATHAKLLYDKDATSKWKLGNSGTEKEVVTISDSQILTNKTIAGGSNTISGLTHGSQVDNPSSGVHGVTGSVVGTTDTQNISGKTLTDALGYTEIATPTTPAAGIVKVYAKTDKKLYKKDSTGLEEEIGSGGGAASSGLITGNNYIPTTDIGSWLTYANTVASATPETMTGGSPTITFTQNLTTPISDIADFLLTKPASNVQGDGVSLTLTSIANKYKSRACIFRFKYFTSSTYVDNAVGLFLYDITGAIVSQLNPLYLKKSGLIESSFAEIQLPNTLTSGLRIGFHVIGTDSTAYTIQFTEFTFDEKVTSQNSSITDFRTSSVTSSWDAGITYNNKKERVLGDSLELEFSFRISGAVSGTFEGTLPYAVDTDKYAYLNNPGRDIDVSGGAYLSTGGYAALGVEFTDLTATKKKFQIVIQDPAANVNTFGRLTNVFPYALSSTNSEIKIKIKVPIQGWSAGTQIADIYTGRTIAADVYLSATQTGINPNNTSVKINFNAVRNDTIGAFSTGAFRYNFLASGWYDFSTTIYLLGSNVLANIYRLHVYKNGSLFFVGDQITPTAGAPFNLTASTKRFFNAGDYLEVYLYGAGNNSASTLSVYEDGTGAWSYFNINRIAGENQPLASEKVIAKYTRSTAQTIAHNTSTVIDFATKEIDTHGAVSGSGASWRFTAPKSSYYSVREITHYGTYAVPANTALYSILYKNTSTQLSVITSVVWAAQTPTANFGAPPLVDLIYLSQGETLRVENIHVQGTGSASASLLGNPSYNYIIIESI